MKIELKYEKWDQVLRTVQALRCVMRDVRSNNRVPMSTATLAEMREWQNKNVEDWRCSQIVAKMLPCSHKCKSRPHLEHFAEGASQDWLPTINVSNRVQICIHPAQSVLQISFDFGYFCLGNAAQLVARLILIYSLDTDGKISRMKIVSDKEGFKAQVHPGNEMLKCRLRELVWRLLLSYEISCGGNSSAQLAKHVLLTP